MDIKKVLEKIDEMTSHNHPVQEIKDWDKIDMSGDSYESSDDEDEGDEDYVDDPYEYDDEYGVRDFAEPGGGSALRAATDDNPRDLPCPACKRDNILTRKDRQLGYQCDRCANAAERGMDMYETQVKKSLKDYISESEKEVDETIRLGFSTDDNEFKRPETVGQRGDIAKSVKGMRQAARSSNVAAKKQFGKYDDPESMGAPAELPTRGIKSVTGNPTATRNLTGRKITVAKTGAKDRDDPLYVPGVIGASAGKKVSESEQIQVVPANQKAMLIKQGDKTLGTVTNPNLAQQIKSSIGKGEMTLAGSKLGEDMVSEESVMSFQTRDDDESMDYHRMADVYKEGDGYTVIFTTSAPGMRAPNPLRTKDVKQAEMVARKYTGNDMISEAKKAKNDAYAIGMAAAKKASGIKAKHATDLPKSVIKKGHDIGKKIKKKQGVAEAEIPNSGPDFGAGLGAGRSSTTLEAKKMASDDIEKAVKKHNAAVEKMTRRSFVNINYKHPDLLKKAPKGYSFSVSHELEPNFSEEVDVTEGANGKKHAAMKHDKKAEKAGKKVAKEIEYDEKVKDSIRGKKRHSEDEKAEKAGTKVTKDLEYDMKKSTKKKVKESMNPKLKAAYQEGYAHGLREQSCRVKHYEDMQEAHKYYEGYKCGLDECYGMVPIQGLVVGEGDMPPATVSGMADQAMEAELDEAMLMDAELDEMMTDIEEMSRTEYMKHKARTTPGNTFSAFGQEFKDTEVLEDDAFAFESLNNQLNALLESADSVTEGLSVSMSTGQPGMQGDSVSVTATDDDASKLLDFVKRVALGGMGPEHAEPEVHAVVARSDYGAPAHTPDDHDSMLAAIKKMTGGDYEEEAGEEAGEESGEEGSCGCDDVQETQTPDQMMYQVAEDEAEDAEVEMTDHDEDAEAEEDKALAIKNIKEGGDGMEGDEEEELTEWANDAGKKGTDEAFETDIDFMTQFISGGLNKPKSTGQTTVPVVAGQKSRMGADDPLGEWKKLSGIK